MNWRYRRPAAVAVVVLGMAVASACSTSGGGSSGSGSSGGVTTITFWARPQNPSVGLAKRWNATHKNIKVQVSTIPDQEAVTKLGAAVRSHSGPDVVDMDDINAPLFAATGITQNISGFVNSLPYKSALNPAMMTLAQKGSQYYAVPYINGASVMMYNKGLFQKAGLNPNAPPTTWAQLLTDAKKISKLGNGVSGYSIPGSCGGCLVYTVWPLIWASGGQVFSAYGPNQTTTYSKYPQVAAALNLYRQLWTSGAVASSERSQDGSTWGELFTSGKQGILVGTPVQIPVARKNGVKVGVAPIPGENGSYSTFVGGDELGVVTGSQHLAADKEFINWMLQPAQQDYVVSAWYLVPVRSDMLNASFESKYPDAAVALKESEKGEVPKSIGFTAATETPNAPWLDAFEKIVFSGADPASTLKQLDTASDQILTQEYQQQVGG